ncbi:MAG: hypothetical protein LQ351_004274 [Letrouitia transgressa]|nr:MAG: hypothetical protein LQ351_004274 [Letrouitia transgressa]
MREFNPKVDAIARMCDGAVDPSDNHLFPLVSPLPLQERLKIDHPNLYTRSLLCEACRSVLKYFAYVVEECKAHKKKAVDLNLLEVALHHETLITLFYSARAGCHLCFILSKHVKGPDDEDLPQFLQETQVEMCWRTELDERETFHGERIQFAVCKKTGPRLPNEYFTFVRLQIWPAKEFGHLFTTLSTQDEFDSMPPSSDGSKDSISDIISDTSSTSAPEEMNSTLFSSSQRSDREASDTNGAANNSDTRTASSICSTSEDSDGSSEFHPRMSQSSTGSASSRRLANLWLSQCRGNKGHLHDDCRNLNGDDQLPTRLIDIRHAMETSVARLVSPHRSPNSFITDRRFVTLSHCWGTWGREGIPVLNMANEQDRFKKGIALEQLPQTFQDAVEVADWLEGSFPIQSLSTKRTNAIVQYHGYG